MGIVLSTTSDNRSNEPKNGITLWQDLMASRLLIDDIVFYWKNQYILKLHFYSVYTALHAHPYLEDNQPHIDTVLKCHFGMNDHDITIFTLKCGTKFKLRSEIQIHSQEAKFAKTYARRVILIQVNKAKFMWEIESTKVTVLFRRSRCFWRLHCLLEGYLCPVLLPEFLAFLLDLLHKLFLAFLWEKRKIEHFPSF